MTCTKPKPLRTGAAGSSCAGNTSGQVALVAVILLALMVTLLGMAVHVIVISEYRSADRQRREDGVFLAAQSGIEYAAAMLRAAPGGSYHGGLLPVKVNNADVTVSRPVLVATTFESGSKPWEDTYQVVAAAAAGPISRWVEAQITVSSAGRVWISSWKESAKRFYGRHRKRGN